MPGPVRSAAGFFFCFFDGGFSTEPAGSCFWVGYMSQGLEGEEEEDEEVELEEDSVNEGEPSDQTRPPVRARLLLALAGTGVLKQGFS